MLNIFYGILINCMVASAEPLSIELVECSPRHAFIRGENAQVTFKIENENLIVIDKTCIVVDVNKIFYKNTPLNSIAQNSRGEYEINIDTRCFKVGNYQGLIQLEQDNIALCKVYFEFYVTKPLKSDSIRLWLWPHKKYENRLKQNLDEAKKQLLWYSNIGINSFQIITDMHAFENEKTYNYFKNLLDFCLVNGWEAGTTAAGGFDEPTDFDKTKKSNNQVTNPCDPCVEIMQNKRNEFLMQNIQHFPQIKLCFFNSEIEDELRSDMCKCEVSEKSVAENTEDFVKQGVIHNNALELLRHKSRYLCGDGLVIANQRASAMVHRYRSDICVFTDPLRKTLLPGRFEGMDMVSTWTYTNPDPKQMLYIETLTAYGDANKKEVMPTITLLNYPGSVAPQENGWILMGPGRLLECCWINLSRKPDGIGVYFGSQCDYFMPDGDEPYQTYEPTYKALKYFSESVLKPFGPMIAKLEKTPRKVAVLSSETSSVYSNSPRLLGFYPNYQIYSFYTLLSMIQLPADVIFDETITEESLSGYDLLVLPKCDVLTEIAYKNICLFQSRGGVVIADQYLQAPIPNILKYDFDFTYRDNVSANAILTGKQFKELNDQPDIRMSQLTDAIGVTAHDDQSIMERYSQQLLSELNSYIQRDIICSNPNVLLNTLQSDGCKYVFIINDKRTYDERLGRYLAIMEKLVPQTVSLSFNLWSEQKLFVFDLLTRKMIPCSNSSGKYTCDVNLTDVGGTILLLHSQRPQNLTVTIPDLIQKALTTQRIDIQLEDDKKNLFKGVVPMLVEIKDPQGSLSEYSDYYAALQGRLILDFIPASNDINGIWTVEVTELITGLKTTKKMHVSIQ